MVRVTKQMLGNTTQKTCSISIRDFYLDQSFLSLAFRETRAAMGGRSRD
jgi:hypothetical protein